MSRPDRPSSAAPSESPAPEVGFEGRAGQARWPASSPRRPSSSGRPGLFRSTAFRLCLTGLIALFATTSIAAEGDTPAPRLRIGWTQTPPELDGRLAEGEWEEAGYIGELTQAIPTPGVQASQRTEVWIMTDGEFLYVGARLWDTNPEEIVAQRLLRDGDTLYDDRFGFSIDPFLDRQNGYFFQVNANGVRRDNLIEGSNVSSSWDTRWFVETSVDAEGWTVEIALPFKSINFDENADVWGLNIARGIRRDDEIDRWADPVRERFLVAMGRAGYLEGMKGIRQGLGIQAIPALTARRLQDEVDNSGDTDIDPSFDLFYKVTPSLTTALTVNTDFSEAEADDRQVNLTRFGLFFPEKRDFFLQDALIFDFGNLDENGRPFFSRRIGLGDDGDVRDIIAGGKVTGRIGPVKIGLIDVVMNERARVDQTNLLVARAAANVLGESTVGAIVTHGNPDANGENTVVGADFRYKDSSFLDNKTFEASTWVQGSFSKPDSLLGEQPGDNTLVDGNGLAYGMKVEYPNDRVRWDIGFQEFQDEFNPALGFVNRVGIRQYEGTYRFRHRPESGPFRTIDHQIEGRLITSSNATNTIRSGEFSITPFVLTTPIIDSIQAKYQRRYEFVTRGFGFLEIGPGEYNFEEGSLKFSTSRNRKLRGEIEGKYGSFFDGTRAQAIADIEFRPSKHLLFRAQYEFNDIRLPGSDLFSGDNDQDRDRKIHIVRGRIDIFITADLSWLTLVQYDTASDQIGFNSRLRWIIEDGREFFLVVNQGLDATDEVRATQTEAVAKLQWTFWF